MAEKTEKDNMLAGALYSGNDRALMGERHHAAELLARYNGISNDSQALRKGLLDELLGLVGEGTLVLSPFTCDYGYNIRIGRNVFVNYHCIFLDCAPIEIGDDVQIGPTVQLYTAQHPLDAAVRRSGLESASPIHIGNEVWIGGGAIVLPGVTIGDRSVVGAGSVVVHDVPPDTLVVGNPARTVRALA